MIRRLLYRTKRSTPDTILTGYGRLYNYFAVDKDIAASGYQVPTQAQYQTLLDYCGDDAGQKLKASGTDHWTTDNGTDIYNFSVRGNGYRLTNGLFNGLKESAKLWCQDNKTINFSDTSTGITFETDDNGIGAGLRLIKTTPTAADLLKSDGEACDPYWGNDGQAYPTVKIGTQVWVSRNLRETKYLSGASVRHVPVAEDWEEAWFVPDLASVYKGGWLFGVSLNGLTGYAMSEEDMQFTNTSGEQTYFPSFDQAVFDTPNITYNGYSDWFLPTKAIWELANAELADMPELQSWYYWTSDEIDEFSAWGADPSAKEINPYPRSYPVRVKAVREVQIPEHACQCIYDNSEGNIFDIDNLVTYEGMIVTHEGQYVIHS